MGLIAALQPSLASQRIRASLPPVLAVAVLASLSQPVSSETVSGLSAAALPSGLRVLVRVDTEAAEKRVRVADLMRQVQAIWEPYVGIVFADSADPPGKEYDDELQLVVSERPGVSASGAPSLGWITFVAPGQPASFMTVSVTAARNMMARSTWMGRPFGQLPMKLSQQFVTRAISWSIAHEIGHYVLRTSRHSRSGLMKGSLTAAEIMWNERGLVQLAPREVEILRLRATGAGLAARLLEPPSDEP